MFLFLTITTQSMESKWHVAYTMPRAEKKVATRITSMGFESYLPVHWVTRQWSDRKVKLELPLFPNYVFVKINGLRREPLYSIKGLVNFVSIDRKPVVLRDREITDIKRVLGGDTAVQVEEYFQQGMKVRITHGQFTGLEGTVLKRNGGSRLLIRIDGLMKAFSFNISSTLTEPVYTNNRHPKATDHLCPK
jgi:transcription antitermination factor NusG